MTTINKKYCICPNCNHSHTISEREIGLYKGMIESLWRVVLWCEQKVQHEFEMSDIKHLLGKNEYARFGDWVHFGGLVYKRGKANYGLNLPRCHEFFAGKRPIPQSVYKNPVTREFLQGRLVTVREIPSLVKFLDENRQYIATYRDPQPSTLL